MNDTITTNIRLPREDWLQLKAAAGEYGMSLNEYLNYLIEQAKSHTFFIPRKEKSKSTIWDLSQFAEKHQNQKEEFILSDDDKITYGI